MSRPGKGPYFWPWRIDQANLYLSLKQSTICGISENSIVLYEIVERVVADLVDRGYDAELLVPEDDVSLEERVRRVNTACFLLGKANVILVSIHVNAAGNGSKWMNATG